MSLQEHYTYDQVRAILGSKRQANLGSNTYAAMPTFDAEADGQIDVTFHRTVVAQLYPNGVVRIDTGGYYTKSTADRIRRFLPDNWLLGVHESGWLLYYKGVSMPFEGASYLHKELIAPYQTYSSASCIVGSIPGSV